MKVDNNRFYIQYYFFALSGLFLGAFIDAVFTQLLFKLDPTSKSKIKMLFVLSLQIITNGVILAAILHKDIAKYIMTNLSGIVFSGLLFGIQSNIFTITQNILGYQKPIKWKLPWWHADYKLRQKMLQIEQLKKSEMLQIEQK